MQILTWILFLIAVGYKKDKPKYENVNKVVPKQIDVVIKDNKISKKETQIVENGVESPTEIKMNTIEKIETPASG